MPKISVITPVYKVEQYFDRCVESILAQTFKDFELILVDDGSPDNSGKMCDEWAKKDERIRVIHQENQGQAIARNNALDIAIGEYIAFVDSDDYVHPMLLEVLYNNLLDMDADISVCQHKWVTEEIPMEPISNLSGVLKYEGKEYTRMCLLNEITCGIWQVYDKLYKKRFFDSIRFPKGRIYEDNAIIYKVVYDCSRVAVCDDVLYYYFGNSSSTVGRSFNKKHLDWLLVPQEMIEYFTLKNDRVLVDKANKMYLSSLEDMLKKVRKHLDDKETEKDLKNRLLAQYRSEKKKYPITVKTHPSLFETLYPKRMKLYWTMKGITNKFKR